MFPGILAQSDHDHSDIIDACAEHELRQARDDHKKEEALRDQDILDPTMAAACALLDKEEAWDTLPYDNDGFTTASSKRAGNGGRKPRSTSPGQMVFAMVPLQNILQWLFPLNELLSLFMFPG